MTKRIFANGIAKDILVVNAVLSAGLTLGAFLPMGKRLQKHLASRALTIPGHRGENAGADAVISGDAIDASTNNSLPSNG